MKFTGRTYTHKGIRYKIIGLDRFTTALIGQKQNYYRIKPSRGKEFITSDYYLKKARWER